MKTSIKDIDLIIFDLDGTLVDSKDDIVNAVNHTLREIDLKEKKSSEISSYIGTGVKDLIRKLLGEKADTLGEKALGIFNGYYKKHCTDKSRLYPGVKEVLLYFKNKRKIIITNRNRDSAITVLKFFGMYNFFEYITGGDDVNCVKPDSCPLDNAMARLDINKERAIIVGDMDIDVLAGKKAGILTCAVTYGIGRKEDILKADPDYTIDDISALKQIIK